uniref:Tf2-1-like SH3-like domain-containing protein n=1 Tax=Peronospora matthiolae TaxID=2874970 RepID=A0AAV1TC80_9STRA
MDADVDEIDVDGIDVDDDDDDGTDVDDDDDDDAGVFSISNDRQIEYDDTLTGEDNVLSAVHMKRTAVDKDGSAEEFLLTREAVVRFVQDSIADALDRQKRNADKHGRANVLSFDKGDLVLLSTINLPKHAVTNVVSSKLLPRYIVSFRVLRLMGNAYTIELPRKMRTHPTLTSVVSARTISARPFRDAKNTFTVESQDNLRVVPFQRASLVE